MKWNKTAAFLIVMSLIAACNNENKGSNADRYTNPDTTAISKAPVDTYSTNAESPTSGPDNAAPGKRDSGTHNTKPAN